MFEKKLVNDAQNLYSEHSAEKDEELENLRIFAVQIGFEESAITS